jgi:hypothetical protein
LDSRKERQGSSYEKHTKADCFEQGGRCHQGRAASRRGGAVLTDAEQQLQQKMAKIVSMVEKFVLDKNLPRTERKFWTNLLKGYVSNAARWAAEANS